MMIDFVLNKKLSVYAKKFGFEKFYPVSFACFDDLRKIKKDLIFVKADKNNLRKIFENDKVDVVVGLESVFKDDNLHYRNSGLNQVLCKLANKNKISVGFSFADVLNGKDRSKVIGRMIQNVSLCRKYKLNIVLGSFAEDNYGLRLRKDLEAFGRLVGIDKLDNEKIFKLKEDKDIKGD